MEPNPIKRMEIFERLVAEIFQRAGELTSVDGSQVGIYIQHPTNGEVVAWPSPAVATDRFLTYLGSSQPVQVIDGQVVEVPSLEEDPHKDAKLLLAQLANGRTIKELGYEELNILHSFAEEKLTTVVAMIEELKMNNQP